MNVESLKKMPFSEVEATLGVLGKHGVTVEGLKAVRRDSALAAKVALLIMTGILTIFKVMMDYSLSLAEMIKLGKYDWVNEDILKHFKVQGSGKQEVDLVLVMVRDVLTWLIAQGQAAADQDWVTLKQVLAYMASHGLVEAAIEQLLFFGAANPDIQREFPIAALGSSCVDDCGNRSCPYLSGDGSERGLGLAWYDGAYHWNDGWRFLAVCK